MLGQGDACCADCFMHECYGHREVRLAIGHAFEIHAMGTSGNKLTACLFTLANLNSLRDCYKNCFVQLYQMIILLFSLKLFQRAA